MNKVLRLHSSNELYGADRSLLRLVSSVNSKFEPHVYLPNDLQYDDLLTRELEKAKIIYKEYKLPT